MKIVIIDDEMYALQSFLSEVIDCDVECRFFKDDEKAVLDYLSRNSVDAVFSDVSMPRVDGIELAEKIVSLTESIPIVFITGMNVTMEDLPEKVRARTLGFLYKPYNTHRLLEYLNVIRRRKPHLEVRTFGSFDCFADGKLVMFSSAKSKELFALLIVYNGNSLTMSDAITHLWQDNDVEKAKILYRNAVFRLRKTLSEVGVECVGFGRAVLTLDKTNISCDFWDFLRTGGDAYRGEFLKSYDWSIEYLPLLDKLADLKD